MNGFEYCDYVTLWHILSVFHVNISVFISIEHSWNYTIKKHSEPSLYLTHRRIPNQFHVTATTTRLSWTSSCPNYIYNFPNYEWINEWMNIDLSMRSCTHYIRGFIIIIMNVKLMWVVKFVGIFLLLFVWNKFLSFISFRSFFSLALSVVH